MDKHIWSTGFCLDAPIVDFGSRSSLATITNQTTVKRVNIVNIGISKIKSPRSKVEIS